MEACHGALAERLPGGGEGHAVGRVTEKLKIDKWLSTVTFEGMI